jgi:hypothetical protein
MFTVQAEASSSFFRNWAAAIMKTSQQADVAMVAAALRRAFFRERMHFISKSYWTTKTLQKNCLIKFIILFSKRQENIPNLQIANTSFSAKIQTEPKNYCSREEMKVSS